MDRLVILGALLVVIIIGAINRRLGGIFGVIFTLGLTYWGLSVLKSGGSLFILKYNLNREIFLIIMGIFLVYNLALAIYGDKKRGE
ncbi:MAG: hypothetical protein N2746_01885 [Deltaproteobacteria bacterium]|nr:hypothetical protein [Deltaproteobacteria bacterium]